MLYKSIFQYGPVGKFLRFEIKRAMVCLLVLICDQLPVPTKENTYFKNSHAIIDLKEEFLSHEIMEVRRKVFEGLFNFVIMLYDFDSYYRERGDWLFWKIRDMPWEILAGKEEPRERWWLNLDKYPYGVNVDKDLGWLRKEKATAHDNNDMERANHLKVIENLVLGRYPNGDKHGRGV